MFHVEHVPEQSGKFSNKIFEKQKRVDHISKYEKFRTENCFGAESGSGIQCIPHPVKGLGAKCSAKL